MIRSDKYPRHGLARALSKLNFCSRRKAVELIRSGAVLVNGIARLDPEWPVHVGQEHIEVSGRKVEKLSDVYVMINKPRGIATQSTDPQGRLVLLETLSELPSLVVVGSLDKTSEGLLLLSNDTVWGARLSDPHTKLEKTYHAQITGEADSALLQKIQSSASELGGVRNATLLRSEASNSWIEIVIDERKNFNIRPTLETLGIKVLRLIRVAIGKVWLGNISQGGHRPLTDTEIRELSNIAAAHPTPSPQSHAPKHNPLRRKRDPRSKMRPPQRRPHVPVDPTDSGSAKPEFRTVGQLLRPETRPNAPTQSAERPPARPDFRPASRANRLDRKPNAPSVRSGRPPARSGDYRVDRKPNAPSVRSGRPPARSGDYRVDRKPNAPSVRSGRPPARSGDYRVDRKPNASSVRSDRPPTLSGDPRFDRKSNTPSVRSGRPPARSGPRRSSDGPRPRSASGSFSRGKSTSPRRPSPRPPTRPNRG